MLSRTSIEMPEGKIIWVIETKGRRIILNWFVSTV
jgi:hypothetical protein